MDPTGRWFGADDLITGPIDEIAVLSTLTIIGAISIYNSDTNKNVAEALKESFTYNLDRIKNFFAQDEEKSEAKTAEKQSLPDMKKILQLILIMNLLKNGMDRKLKIQMVKVQDGQQKMEMYGYQKTIKVHTHHIGMSNIKMAPIHLFIRSNHEIV